MELHNEFRVAVPVAKTWEVFTDVERVAPCLPGATLLSVDGDEFTGAVKVKVGPITVSYKGVAAYKEKDEAGRRIVLRAEGKETRGNGTAAATVTAQLKDEGRTILLVEQNAARTVLVADRVYIMRTGGRIEFEGSGDELTERGGLETAYMGF